MIQKYMDELKKEILTIKKESETIEDFVYGRTGTTLGFTYRVILKNRTEFYVSIDSYKFPDFDPDDIVYIEKKFFDSSSEDFDHYIDTEIGEYYVNSGNYSVLIYKLFNVASTFETGCFEGEVDVL